MKPVVTIAQLSWFWRNVFTLRLRGSPLRRNKNRESDSCLVIARCLIQSIHNRPPFSFVNAGPGVLPVFVARHVHTNRDSLNSEFAGHVKTETTLPLSPLSSVSLHSVGEKKISYDECYGHAL